MHRIALATILLLTPACGDDAPSGKDGDAAADSADSAGDTTSDTAADSAGDTQQDTRTDTTSTPCDPVHQTGCTANENCTYVGSSPVASCVESGPVPANHECSSENRCEHGVCMSINDTADYCYQLCEADTDCGAGTANVCLTLNGVAFKVCKIPGIYEECNLLTQACTDATKACYAVANEPEPICLTEGEGAPGAECGSADACKKGYACVNDVCRALCDPDVADSCGATATCRDFFDDAGYCAPN